MKEKLLALLVIFLFTGLVVIKVTIGNEHQQKIESSRVKAFPVVVEPAALPNKTIYGYLVLRGDSSAASLKRNISSIDGVIVDALHLNGDDMTIDNEEKQNSVFEYIRAQKGSKKIIAMLNNYSGGKWLGDKTALMMASDQDKGKAISEVLEYVEKNKVDGISLDFESLPESAQDNLVTFTSDLKKALAKDNVTVSVHVPADDSTWKYKDLGQAADQIILMNYDEHRSTTEPGPIASAEWFEGSLKKLLKDVPASKLVVGLGSYAYDWVEQGSAQSLSYGAAALNVKKYGADITVDLKTKNSYYIYTDASGKKHIVWLLDHQNLAVLSKIAAKYAVEGVALYRFGSEDEAAWKVLK